MAQKKHGLDVPTLNALLATCSTQVDAQETSYAAFQAIDYTVSVYWDVCQNTDTRKRLAFWVTDRSDETFVRFGLKNPDRPSADDSDDSDTPNTEEDADEYMGRNRY